MSYQVVISLLVFLIFGLAIGHLSSCTLPRDKRRFIRRFFIGAFVVRLVLVFVLYFAFDKVYGSGLLPNGDTEKYHRVSQHVANLPLRAWSSVYYPDNEPCYYVLSALLYRLFGTEALATQFASALFGALTVIYVYKICQFLFDEERLARLATCLVAFFPILLYYSAVNMKDVPIAFLIIFMFYQAILFTHHRKHLGSLVLIAICGYILFSVRRETALATLALLGSHLLAAFLLKQRMLKMQTLLILVVSALVFSLLLFFIANYDITTLSQFLQKRQAKILGQTSDSSLTRHLASIDLGRQPYYLPLVVGIYLVMPFPFWHFSQLHTVINHLAHAACLPLLFFFIWGTLRAFKSGRVEQIALAVVVWAFLVSSAVLVMGSAPRFKVQFMPLVLVLITIGLGDYRRVRQLYWVHWSVFFVGIALYAYLKYDWYYVVSGSVALAGLWCVITAAVTCLSRLSSVA